MNVTDGFDAGSASSPTGTTKNQKGVRYDKGIGPQDKELQEVQAVPTEPLRDLVDPARLSASGANPQPLKYLLSWEKETNDKIPAG